jgi:hypothetical protein
MYTVLSQKEAAILGGAIVQLYIYSLTSMRPTPLGNVVQVLRIAFHYLILGQVTSERK